MVHLVAGRPLGPVAAELEDAGLELQDPRDRGQLLLLDARTTFRTDRALPPEESLVALRALIERAVGDGYPGLRVSSDSD